MNHKVGIWIDHKKALIVSASADRLTAMTVESDVGPQTWHAGGGERPGAASPVSSRGENKPEHRDDPRLDRYYDEVIGQLGQPEALLIFGPGEAKLELSERLTHVKVLSDCIVSIETTDTLTDPQIVSKVRQHYLIAPPGGSAPRDPARRGGAQ
jgi:hypothetical protein